MRPRFLTCPHFADSLHQTKRNPLRHSRLQTSAEVCASQSSVRSTRNSISSPSSWETLPLQASQAKPSSLIYQFAGKLTPHEGSGQLTRLEPDPSCQLKLQCALSVKPSPVKLSHTALDKTFGLAWLASDRAGQSLTQIFWVKKKAPQQVLS